jgi:hypothetical protein
LISFAHFVRWISPAAAVSAKGEIIHLASGKKGMTLSYALLPNYLISSANLFITSRQPKVFT